MENLKNKPLFRINCTLGVKKKLCENKTILNWLDFYKIEKISPGFNMGRLIRRPPPLMELY